jgi:hypothetical protein
MGAVVLPAKSDPSHPFVDEPGILPDADMIGMINPARESVIFESASSTFEPGEQTATGGLEEFELNGAAGFLLNYASSRANPAAADQVADLDLDDVAPAQLAVDREIEHRAIAYPPLPIKPKPDGQTCWAFNARLAPSFRSAFHGRRSLATGSYSESPITFHLLATVGQVMIERRRAGDERADGRGQTGALDDRTRIADVD